MENNDNPSADQPYFLKVSREARYGTLTEEERCVYDHSLKVYRDNYAIAQTERNLSLAEGRAEGIALGDAKATARIVKNLLQTELPLDKIANAFGLTIEEVKKIIEDTQ